MRMTAALVIAGAFMLFFATFFIVAVLPWITIPETPSDIFRPRTAAENQGRDIYVNNGCTYCHSQFIRPIDWGWGAQRIAQVGDYIADQPHLLGTERTGPDLSQEGGQRPDDWHIAHFINPRFVSPASVMPNLQWLGDEKIKLLTAYVQSLGFKMADFRVARQNFWKQKAVSAYRSGPDQNMEWIHSWVPKPWRELPNPYPPIPSAIARGHRIYQQFCIGCHGSIGDGMGPAEPFLNPPPLNFTIVKGRGISGGIIYYQVMNGITGTGMPYFKEFLESEKIWDVGHYISTFFIGQTDADGPPEGIDAAYEPPYEPPKPPGNKQKLGKTAEHPEFGSGGMDEEGNQMLPP